ncbi:unnamed protein product, partial [Mesorhabditis spiculigera]
MFGTKNRTLRGLSLFLLLMIITAEFFLLYLVIEEGNEARKTAVRHFKSDLLVHGKDTKLTDAIDSIQMTGNCCGSSGFDDYLKNVEEEDDEYEAQTRMKVQYVPDSCCKSIKAGCGINDHPSNIYYRGCEQYLIRTVDRYYFVLFALCLLAIPIHTFLLLLISCICCRSKKKRHYTPVRTKATKTVGPDFEMSFFD